jgi:hypothetical protein
MLLIICPNCQQFVEILEINCAIFRHGIFKVSGQQIDPHTPKAQCDQYMKEGLIYGCGKPFKVIVRENILLAEVCEYI